MNKGENKDTSVWKYSAKQERQWMIITILCSLGMLGLVPFMAEFQNSTVSQDFLYQSKQDILFLLIFVPILSIFKSNLINYLEKQVDNHIIDKSRFRDEQSVKTRTRNLAKFIYGIGFYSSMSIWGIQICINEVWFPYSLGGSGHVSHAFDEYPKISDNAMQKGLKWYYLTQLAYRIETYLYLNLMNSEPKYWEYSLHHLLAIYTVVISYSCNLLHTGTLTFIYHDLSDVFMQISRGYNDYKHRKETVLRINALLNVIAWFWYRIVEESILIYFGYQLTIFTINNNIPPQIFQIFRVYYTVGLTLIFVLIIMNIHWFNQLIKVIIHKFKYNTVLVEDQTKKTN